MSKLRTRANKQGKRIVTTRRSSTNFGSPTRVRQKDKLTPSRRQSALTKLLNESEKSEKYSNLKLVVD